VGQPLLVVTWTPPGLTIGKEGSEELLFFNGSTSWEANRQ